MDASHPVTLVSVGHGTLAAVDLATLLRKAGVQLLVDVRRYPGSRRHPDLSRDSLAETLPAGGVPYRWEERLGGRRGVPADQPDVDRWWRVEQFCGYAAHSRTPEFQDALNEVLVEAEHQRVAVMCSETVWWRCHRRLVADVAILTRSAEVLHLGHDGKLGPHPVAEGARVREDGFVVWDGEGALPAP